MNIEALKSAFISGWLNALSTAPLRLTPEQMFEQWLKEGDEHAAEEGKRQENRGSKHQDADPRGQAARPSDSHSAVQSREEKEKEVELEAASLALKWLNENVGCEVSKFYPDECGEPGFWVVWQVWGNRSDREWRMVGKGSKPVFAIHDAMLRNKREYMRNERNDQPVR